MTTVITNRTIEERRTRAAALQAYAATCAAVGRTTVQRTRWGVMSSRALLDRLRPPFAGGADVQPDDAGVRQRVRGLIDAGILPRFSSGRLLAGPCRVVHNCTVCGGGVKVGEQEVEIVSCTGAVVIHLHRGCLEIWTQEATDGDGPPHL